MAVMQQIAASQVNPEVPINENFESLEALACFSKNPDTTRGLTWGYLGGRLGGTAITAGTVTLSNGTNYVVMLRSSGAVSTSTSTTNWNDTTNYARLYKVTAASSVVTATEDHRLGMGGLFSTAQPARRASSQSDAYTAVLADQEVYIFHPAADTTARTFTIPANSSVAYPVGTVLEFVNENGAGTVTISITTDTMRLVPGGTTGSRTLAANGVAWARKVTSTSWQIWGFGLT